MSSEQPGTNRPKTGELSSQYTIESHMLSTRSADAYKAVVQAEGVGVCLWMLRHPLRQNSDAVRRFLSRTEKIKNISPTVVDIRSFGVDSGGMAYAVLPPLDGLPLMGGKLEPSEAERRFLSCLNLVAKLHSEGIVCGDLCGSSFWISRPGEIQFIGVMGSFDTEAAATAMLPPMDTLNFVAPEQRSGGGLEPASDVFALGVIGYHLLTGSFPYPTGAAMFTGNFSPDQIKPISAFIPTAPPWAQEVLMKCLEANPTLRYSNAGDVYKAVVDIRQRAATGEQAPVRTRREAIIVGGDGSGSSSKSTVTVSSHKPTDAQYATPRSGGRWISFFLAFLVGAILVVSWFLTQRGGDNPQVNREMLQLNQVATDQQMKTAINVLGQQQASIEEREAQLSKLASSDDPLANDLLVKSAKGATTDQERGFAEKAVIERARRLGLLRAAEQARQWLRTVQTNQIPACYESVLRSMDTTLPLDAIGTTLKQVYASNPKLALRLTAALGLDTGKYEDYQPILSQLVADATHSEEPLQRSLLALIIADPELSIIYGDDIIQQRDKFPEKDTIWSLKMLADRGDQNVRAIANLAMERNLLSPLRKVFLTYVRDRNDLPAEVLAALIRASAGALKPSDIGEFGRWYNLESERILLTIMADTEDPTLLTDCFDTISGKSLTIEPSATMIEWVREHHWDNRAELAHAIGVFANLDILGEEGLKSITTVIDKYSKEKGFINLLVKSENPLIARLLADRFSEKLGISGLLNFLDNPDKAVRITAVKGLKDVNEVSLLKIIIEKYEKEQDSDVRQAFRDTFWVIKEREEKR